MISIALARDLADRGLLWEPAAGDRFVVDQESLHDQVFWISELVIELQSSHGIPLLGFNGTTEWALDSVLLDEVVWLPREDQLRVLLGDRFRSLARDGDEWVVTIQVDDTLGAVGEGGIDPDAAVWPSARTLRFAHADCESAYAAALLDII